MPLHADFVEYVPLTLPLTGLLERKNGSMKRGDTDSERGTILRGGFSLVATRDHEDEFILRVGSLMDDPGSRPMAHIWSEERAPWFDPTVDLAAFPRRAPPEP